MQTVKNTILNTQIAKHPPDSPKKCINIQTFIQKYIVNTSDKKSNRRVTFKEAPEVFLFM